MKTMLIVLFAVGVLTAVGQVAQPNDNDTPVQQELRYIDFNDPAWWKYMEQTDANVPKVTLGRTDYQIRGPIIDNLRPRPSAPKGDILDRMTRIPLVGLFVPQRHPTLPTERGRYFAWGQGDVPWSTLGDRSGPAVPVLVSFSR